VRILAMALPHHAARGVSTQGRNLAWHSIRFQAAVLRMVQREERVGAQRDSSQSSRQALSCIALWAQRCLRRSPIAWTRSLKQLYRDRRVCTAHAA